MERTPAKAPFVLLAEVEAFVKGLEPKLEKLQEKPEIAVDLLPHFLDLRRRMVQNYIVSHFGLVVQGGPFSGMRLLEGQIGSLTTPRLLGTYEAELHRLVYGAGRYTRIVNVGCADGWYAVGLARRFPHLTVLAFDIDQAAREACAVMAETNGVRDRIEIQEGCSAADLEALVRPGTLVLMDIEGAEKALLEAIPLATAARCDWIVETHGIGTENTRDSLYARFSETLNVTEIPQQMRTATHPVFEGLRQMDIFLAQWEGRRVENAWLSMTRHG